MKTMIIYVVISGFKNLRYKIPSPSGINLNPRKLTVFEVVD